MTDPVASLNTALESKALAEAVQAIPPPPQLARRLKHVLVVEDSRTQALQMKLLLESAGFEVETAADGIKALDRLHESEPVNDNGTLYGIN